MGRRGDLVADRVELIEADADRVRALFVHGVRAPAEVGKQRAAAVDADDDTALAVAAEHLHVYTGRGAVRVHRPGAVRAGKATKQLRKVGWVAWKGQPAIPHEHVHAMGVGVGASVRARKLWRGCGRGYGWPTAWPED